MRSFFGQAAGATLGFIYNNTKGAIIGRRMGKYATSRRKLGVRTVRGKPAGVAKTRGKQRVKYTVAKTRRATSSKSLKRRNPIRKRRGGGAPHKLGGTKVAGSFFSIGTGPKLYRGFKRQHLPTTFTSTLTQRVTAGTSVQSCSILPTYNFGAGYQTTPNGPDLPWSSAWTIDKILIDRAEKWLATNTIAPQNVGPYNNPPYREGARQTQKFVINYMRYDQMIRNMSNQDITITLYDCVFRAGVQPNERTAGTANLQPTVDPILDWEQGIPSIQAFGPFPGPTREVIGSTPFQSSVFCKLYKIRKVTKHVLASGEVHHHHVTVKPSNLYDTVVGQRLSQPDGPALPVNSRGAFQPGLTGFTMMVASGSIVNKPDPTTGTVVGLSKTALDVVTTTSGSFANYTRERRMHLTFDAMSRDDIMHGISDDTDTPGPVAQA